jgi:hypothetical protein
LYAAGAVLVLAQLVGIYALVTKTADLVFAVLVTGALVVAIAMGGYGVYHQIR